MTNEPGLGKRTPVVTGCVAEKKQAEEIVVEKGKIDFSIHHWQEIRSFYLLFFWWCPR